MQPPLFYRLKAFRQESDVYSEFTRAKTEMQRLQGKLSEAEQERGKTLSKVQELQTQMRLVRSLKLS